MRCSEYSILKVRRQPHWIATNNQQVIFNWNQRTIPCSNKQLGFYLHFTSGTHLVHILCALYNIGISHVSENFHTNNFCIRIIYRVVEFDAVFNKYLEVYEILATLLSILGNHSPKDVIYTLQRLCCRIQPLFNIHLQY